ncbi:hypothetical protein So717_37200 [Roseobacter cerasinus]|uniref:General secretion pathway protein K n=2 Tax=Roseobacter cerasinus TaxID=2602289 RepID=A0A640VVT2_9RHOB|nr:hypothetical protein So717_37200 [Roseobacter cerasinus]
MQEAARGSPVHAPHARRHGYALIVVLGALVILAFLASHSSKTLLAEHQSGRATQELQQRQALSMDAVTYVFDLALGAQTPARLPLPGHDDVWVELVDLGGLVDLRTARSGLAAQVIDALDLTADQERRFRNWQRASRDEADLSAFLRAIGGTPDQLVALSRVATLRSGRPGVAPQQAPQAVLDLFSEADGAGVPAAFTSQPLRTLRQVWVNRGGARWLAGEVRLADDSSGAWLWAP